MSAFHTGPLQMCVKADRAELPLKCPEGHDPPAGPGEVVGLLERVGDRYQIGGAGLSSSNGSRSPPCSRAVSRPVPDRPLRRHRASIHTAVLDGSACATSRRSPVWRT
ncbi:hypothetical protein HBB16_15835 [Pseudonocardia sp. MCCB 268]|nr:hypothetical protein [Pseudonocardia cytotoxica]